MPDEVLQRLLLPAAAICIQEKVASEERVSDELCEEGNGDGARGMARRRGIPMDSSMSSGGCDGLGEVHEQQVPADVVARHVPVELAVVHQSPLWTNMLQFTTRTLMSLGLTLVLVSSSSTSPNMTSSIPASIQRPPLTAPRDL